MATNLPPTDVPVNDVATVSSPVAKTPAAPPPAVSAEDAELVKKYSAFIPAILNEKPDSLAKILGDLGVTFEDDRYRELRDRNEKNKIEGKRARDKIRNVTAVATLAAVGTAIAASARGVFTNSRGLQTIFSGIFTVFAGLTSYFLSATTIGRKSREEGEALTREARDYEIIEIARGMERKFNTFTHPSDSPASPAPSAPDDKGDDSPSLPLEPILASSPKTPAPRTPISGVPAPSKTYSSQVTEQRNSQATLAPSQ